MKRQKTMDTLASLRSASPPRQFVTALTSYRIIAFPLLLVLIFSKHLEIFKWLLIVSFLTDAVDGYLARKYKATSVLGSKLDSIGDDLTVLAGVIGVLVFKYDFIRQEVIAIAIPIGLLIIQLSAALIRYAKPTSFHTYLAKVAAVLQGFFLCAIFLLEEPVYWLFYAAVFITTLELIEEIILVAILPEWKVDVRGLYWILKKPHQ